ncbi:hypothetical protein ABFX02_09G014500 [Erythranthe guttata]
MKKNQKHEQQQQEEKEDIEILKAVAQAWHGQSSSARSSTTAASEFDAHRRFFKGRPTRFKIEAATNLATTKKNKDDSCYHHQCGPSWDFRQSLWDSYEIISVSKKLETGLVMADPFSALENGSGVVKKRKEGKNSLRNLFNKMSSRRFSEEDLPSD